ncbi:MAG: response regulator [Magnetococcus sp. YQC-3]
MRIKILLVDDEPNNTDLFARILERDYAVVVANSGEDALQMAATHKPDLILLDVMMPGMDGFVVCEKLKANQETNAIPIIFVTAAGEATNETRGLELGAEDFITKPVSRSVVEVRVRKILERTKLTTHLEGLVEGLDFA